MNRISRTLAPLLVSALAATALVGIAVVSTFGSEAEAQGAKAKLEAALARLTAVA